MEMCAYAHDVPPSKGGHERQDDKRGQFCFELHPDDSFKSICPRAKQSTFIAAASLTKSEVGTIGENGDPFRCGWLRPGSRTRTDQSLPVVNRSVVVGPRKV